MGKATSTCIMCRSGSLRREVYTDEEKCFLRVLRSDPDSTWAEIRILFNAQFQENRHRSADGLSSKWKDMNNQCSSFVAAPMPTVMESSARDAMSFEDISNIDSVRPPQTATWFMPHPNFQNPTFQPHGKQTSHSNCFVSLPITHQPPPFRTHSHSANSQADCQPSHPGCFHTCSHPTFQINPLPTPYPGEPPFLNQYQSLPYREIVPEPTSHSGCFHICSQPTFQPPSVPLFHPSPARINRIASLLSQYQTSLTHRALPVSSLLVMKLL